MKKYNVSVVVPMYQEEKNIEMMIHTILDSMGQNSYVHEFELICVDDASTDSTFQLMLAYHDVRVRYLRLRSHAGKSEALFAGFKAARYDWIVVMDADLQTHPDDLTVLLRAMHDCDHGCVGARIKRSDVWMKRMSTRVARKIRNAVLNDGFIDSVCPLGVYSKHAILSIPRFDCYHRYFPYLLKNAGYSIQQAPIRHFYRIHGKSHYGTFDRAVEGISSLIVLWWLKRHGVGSVQSEEIVDKSIIRNVGFEKANDL